MVLVQSEDIARISEDGEGSTVRHPKRENLPIPWKKIVTSIPVWAILIAHCCQNWGFYTLLTELPTYMKQILHFDIKTVSQEMRFFNLYIPIQYVVCFTCFVLD